MSDVITVIIIVISMILSSWFSYNMGFINGLRRAKRIINEMYGPR